MSIGTNRPSAFGSFRAAADPVLGLNVPAISLLGPTDKYVQQNRHRRLSIPYLSLN
jgi:hypothetical protein